MTFDILTMKLAQYEEHWHKQIDAPSVMRNMTYTEVGVFS
jgi:hypothetical protein